MATIQMIDPQQVLQALAESRGVFHSEADFRFALACQITRDHHCDVRLERRRIIEGRVSYVDIWVDDHEHKAAIELKYKTRQLDVTVDHEDYSLRNQSAHDNARYDFLSDVRRLENLVRFDQTDFGYAIMLTNDPLYWRDSGREKTMGEEFRIHHGTLIEGARSWADHAGRGTTIKREDPIPIQGRYQIEWKDYGRVDEGSRWGEFKYTIVNAAP